MFESSCGWPYVRYFNIVDMSTKILDDRQRYEITKVMLGDHGLTYYKHYLINKCLF